jgi:hypothetical protein
MKNHKRSRPLAWLAERRSAKQLQLPRKIDLASVDHFYGLGHCRAVIKTSLQYQDFVC